MAYIYQTIIETCIMRVHDKTRKDLILLFYYNF